MRRSAPTAPNTVLPSDRSMKVLLTSEVLASRPLGRLVLAGR
jgi:hypothetical protein